MTVSPDPFSIPNQLETMDDVLDAMSETDMGQPVYATTPHGTYLFVLAGFKEEVVEGESRIVLQLREVQK